MNERRQGILLSVSGALALAGLLQAIFGGEFWPVQTGAYAALALLPGFGVSLLVRNRGTLLELAMASLVLSPVVIGIAGTAALLVGLSPELSARVLLALSCVFAHRILRKISAPKVQSAAGLW